MTRVCDSCQPTVDGAFDAINKARRARDEAQGIAWKSTDLMLRWQELHIERDNLTDDDYISFLNDLASETKLHILTAPVYTMASASLNSGAGAGLQGEGASVPASEPGEAY